MAEYKQCKNCKGTGRVPKAYGHKRWETCPICKGIGKIKIKNKK